MFYLELLAACLWKILIIGYFHHVFAHLLPKHLLDLIWGSFCIFNRIVKQRCGENVNIINLSDVSEDVRHLQRVIDVRFGIRSFSDLAPMLLCGKGSSPEQFPYVIHNSGITIKRKQVNEVSLTCTPDRSMVL